MTAATIRRASCVDHRDYVAGCNDCRSIRRAWYADRPQMNAVIPADPKAEWVLSLTGEFAGRMGTHELPVPDGEIGRRRAAWWTTYRRDVAVVLRTRRKGAKAWTEVTV